MEFLILEFPELIVDKYLAIVSFDSGPLVPSELELQRGWTSQNNIAYFDKISEFELFESSLFDQYDQWMIFDNKKRFESMEIFVNIGGFSADFKKFRKTSELEDTSRFWNQVEKIKPQKFILNGDKLIFGTNNSREFERVKSHYEFCNHA